MSDYIAMLRTQAEAVMVRVYGMQTANDYRKSTGDSPAYNEQAFLTCQQELECIADQINQARSN